jgi:hypothetical protein
MATFRSFEAFGREVEALGRELREVEKRRITKAQAERGQVIARRAASNDLGGDPKFSGWKPELDTQVTVKADGSSVLGPTRSSAGPWTVAQSGRNRGNASGVFGPAAPRFNKNGAVRKVRARKARRWNGTTDGKQTADDAVRMIESDAEIRRLAEDGLRRATRQHFDVT